MLSYFKCRKSAILKDVYKKLKASGVMRVYRKYKNVEFKCTLNNFGRCVVSLTDCTLVVSDCDFGIIWTFLF